MSRHFRPVRGKIACRTLKAAKASSSRDVPANEVIRRIANDPNTFLAEGAASATAELLPRFIERIELDTNRATIGYPERLPAGSQLAGARLQVVTVPNMVAA